MMEFLGIAIFTLAGAFLLIVIIVTPYLVVRNVRQGRKLQKHLEERVSALRLNRMLKKRDIRINEYLRRERLADIRQQVDACVACESLEDCDHFLESTHEPAKQKADFCPNQAAIKKISKKYGH